MLLVKYWPSTTASMTRSPVSACVIAITRQLLGLTEGFFSGSLIHITVSSTSTDHTVSPKTAYSQCKLCKSFCKCSGHAAYSRIHFGKSLLLSIADKTGEATATLNRSNSQVALNSAASSQIMSPTTPGLTTPTTPEPTIPTSGNNLFYLVA